MGICCTAALWHGCGTARVGRGGRGWLAGAASAHAGQRVSGAHHGANITYSCNTLHRRNHRWHALLVRGQSALVGGVACAPSCGMVDWLSAAYCGGQAAGARSIFAYGVLPATMPRFISYLLYRWEETIRATVVIGLVGAGGLGRLLTNQLVSFNYQGVLTTLIIFVSITFAVDLVSALARSAFRG